MVLDLIVSESFIPTWCLMFIKPRKWLTKTHPTENILDGINGNAVGDYLYRETAGNHGTVGGVMINIQSVCKGEVLREE